MASRQHEILLSQNAVSLVLSAKAHCLSKIETIKEDPYLLKKSDLDVNFNNLPNVDYTDIINYLVYSTSYLTAKEMNAKKSLQAYNNFLSGLVLEAAIKHYEKK